MTLLKTERLTELGSITYFCLQDLKTWIPKLLSNLFHRVLMSRNSRLEIQWVPITTASIVNISNTASDPLLKWNIRLTSGIQEVSLINNWSWMQKLFHLFWSVDRLCKNVLRGKHLWLQFCKSQFLNYCNDLKKAKSSSKSLNPE